MWDLFFIATIVGVSFIFLPGYLILRGCSLHRFAAGAFSPLLAVFIYAFLGIVYGKIGITCSWVNVFGPFLAISIVFYGVSKAIRRKHASNLPRNICDDAPSRFSKIYLLAYLLVSIALGCFFFLSNLSSADSFFQAYDNIFHLDVIRSFIDSGDWSLLTVTLYETATFNPPLPGGSFYPAGWHILCALLVSALNIPITLSVNAINFIFAFLVFPIGILCLFKAIFKENRTLILIGSIISLAFASFPWGFLTFGPLYPNLTSFALLPLLITAFIKILSTNERVVNRLFWTIVFIVGIGSLAVTQPNAVFSAGVFLASYCVYRIFLASKQRFDSLPKALLCAACFVLFVCAFWWVLYNAPFMQSTLSQLYPKYYTKTEAVIHFLLLWFRDSSPNYLLAILVIVGGLFTLKHRKFLWLSFSYAIAGILYLVDASCVDVSFLKNLLTGFWYSDIYRMEGMLGLFGIPLASLGVYAIYNLILNFFTNNHAIETRRSNVKYKLLLSLILAITILLYLPTSWPITTQFYRVSSNICNNYSLSSDSILSSEEKDFLKEVKEIVGDSLVVNIPDDGSAFAYPIEDINTYYRNTRTYGTSSESIESKNIRNDLNLVATDLNVQKSLSSIDAEYVLLLDQGTSGSMPCLFTWDWYSDLWQGISTIGDSTPGFTLVLSSQDMRLYKIDAVK